MNKKDITTAVVVTYIGKIKKELKASSLGWYTNHLLEKLPLKTKQKIVVLSDIKSKDSKFKKNDILVNECWKRGSIFFWLDIINHLKKFPDLKTIHFQHEFNQFGGLITIPFSLLLYFYLKKFLKKNILITIHGVISLKIIDANFTKVNNLPLPPFLVKMFFSFFYKTAGSIADRFIVTEEKFKNVLINEYHYKKPIDVINIGVEQKKVTITKAEARKELKINQNKKVVLYFGFLAGYKGLDLLVDAFSSLKGDYVLIIAGGKPARVEKDKKYSLWFDKLQEKCNNDTRITMTGFLSDDRIESYFVASDLCVLPYLMPLGASGPMTHAIAYGIPFIASDAFKDTVDNKFLFSKGTKSLRNKITGFFKLRNKSIYYNYVYSLRKYRTWEICANKTNLIYKQLDK